VYGKHVWRQKILSSPNFKKKKKKNKKEKKKKKLKMTNYK